VGQVRVGTSGWSYPTWVGSFYPDGTPPARMLRYYGEQFGAVEAHSTHRRLPSPAALSRWVAAVPVTFRFAPKAHAGITHRRDLDDVDHRVRAFLDTLEPLGERLGPILFVLPHRQPDLDRLDRLLAALAEHPRAVPVFELAPAWWVDDVRRRLAAAGASLALVDRDGEPPPTDTARTADAVSYVRLRRSGYTAEELGGWAERLRHLAADGNGRDVYAFVKHDEEGHGPRYARALVQHLEQE
jgi:uncharacterized protein YecE (DUF72 family)